MSETRASLFVRDTGPRITLATADSLDYLLYRNVPVVIPDAVFYEATRDIAKLGAKSIIDWVKAHHTHIEIAVTNPYLNVDTPRSVNPRARETNLRAQAAIEVIEEPARMQGDDKGSPSGTVIQQAILASHSRDRDVEKIYLPDPSAPAPGRYWRPVRCESPPDKKALAADMQRQTFIDVPCMPVGLYY